MDKLFASLFPKKEIPTGTVEFLIVGLGNPGPKYEYTRHNAGFLTINTLAQKLGVQIDRMKFKSLCADAMMGGKRVLLMKPQTFMNNSGEAVREAMNFYKIPPENILVIFDDISLPVGKLRIRPKGSAGGHNGIKSIIQHSGSENFPRVKVGVGAKPNPGWDLADWVLSEFSKEEREILAKTAQVAVDACIKIVEGKYNEALNLISKQ